MNRGLGKTIRRIVLNAPLLGGDQKRGVVSSEGRGSAKSDGSKIKAVTSLGEMKTHEKGYPPGGHLEKKGKR